MRTNPIGSTAAAVALLLALAGCASADPVVELDPAPAGAAAPTAAAETFTTAMTEITAHGLGADAPAPAIVSDGATVDVAVAEIAAALPVQDEALAFIAATAFELGRADAGAVTSVDLVAAPPSVVGLDDGRTVATVALTQQVTPGSGAVTETRTTYALIADGDTLVGVGAWAPGLDSGIGLSSPTGAAQRFVDLVRDGDTAAVERFSGGVTTTTEIGVLAAALTGVDDVVYVDLPQALAGSTHIVYALDGDAHVLARFEVTEGDDVTVVYTPTA